MGYAKWLPRVGGSLFWLSAVFPLPDNAAPLRLPCVRGGGFAPAKPEGLFRAAKRGTYIYFCVCRQPLSHGKAATAPLTQGSREADSHGRKYAFSYAHRSRLPGCTGEPWAGAGLYRLQSETTKAFCPLFFFKEKVLLGKIKQAAQLCEIVPPVNCAIRVFLLPAFLFQRKRLMARSISRQLLSQSDCCTGEQPKWAESHRL